MKAGEVMHSMRQALERFKIVRLALTIYRIRAVRALFPLLIIALVYREGRQELKELNLGRTMQELRDLSSPAIIQMLIISLLAVSVMSAYDYLIRGHFQLKIGLWSTFRYAWIANTFNNIIGFAGLAGVGLRTLLYKKSGVPTSVLTPAIVFLSPLMITGLSLLSWANIFGLLPAADLMETHRWLRFAIWGMALYLPFFVFVQRSSLYAKWINRGKGRTPWITVTASVTASFLEWLFAGIAFWTIGNHLLGGVHFITIFSIYAIAAIAGILSMAPGGIGAFDLIALLGLTQMGYESDQAMAVLVIFRLFYYIIPWLVGLVLAALEIGLQGKKMLERNGPGLETSLNLWQRTWRWPGQLPFLSDLGVWALGQLVLAGGLILLLSAATPELLYRLQFTETHFSLPVMRLSHFLSVLIGFMLILISGGIALRIRRAFVWTSIFLFAGAVFSFTKGFDYEEALFLLFVLLLLWISRARFYRISVPLTRQNGIWLLALSSIIAFGYSLLGSYSHRGFLKRLPQGMQPEWLQQHSHFAFTAAGCLILAWLLFLLILMLKPQTWVHVRADRNQLERLENYLKQNPGNSMTHLLFLGDKSLYWSQGGRVLLPYARVRDKLVVLGDPLGPLNLISKAIGEMREEADRYGLNVVFYQATPAYLQIYHEQGYQSFTMGEEAVVPLDAFASSSKNNADLAGVRERFEQERYAFEIARPPHSETMLKELSSISNEWLSGRTEKGYSLGWFNKSYLQRVPVALLRSTQGEMLAYASIASGYDEGKDLSIGLMRHRRKMPNGIMEFLLLRLLEWSQIQGYTRFSLGNAPLPAIGYRMGLHREEKLAHLVFKRGSRGYGFEGLRRYKEKFDPEWEPRYVAYPATLSLPILMLDLLRLVSSHPDPEDKKG